MDIGRLARLANLKVDQKEEDFFKVQFAETLKIVEEFDSLDTSKVQETHSISGSENVTREDEIDALRILSQEAALTNAKKTHNGFFVVPAVLK